MNFLSNKTIVRAIGFSIAVAAFLYVLVTQQDMRTKDQTILNLSNRVTALAHDVKTNSINANNDRNRILSVLSVSIDNQRKLIASSNQQNIKYQQLLNYLKSVGFNIPIQFSNGFNSSALNSVQTHKSKTNKKSVKKSTKKASKSSCLLCLVQIPQIPLTPLPSNLSNLMQMQLLNLKQ